MGFFTDELIADRFAGNAVPTLQVFISIVCEATESSVPGLGNLIIDGPAILLGPDLIGERGAGEGVRVVPTDGRPLRIG